MGRKPAGSATELKPVEPEPKDASTSSSQPPADPKDAAASAASTGAAGTGESSAPSKETAEETQTRAGSKPGTETGAAPEPAQSAAADEEERPPPPPRPKPERRVSGFSSNLAELRAAFPDTEEAVLRALLVAASNNLEAAFTGMLAITDPTIRPAAYINEQIERDARLARRLAESQSHTERHERSARRATRERGGGRAPSSREAPEEPLAGDDLYDEFSRGFSETKQAVSSFWGSLKQRISNEVYDDDQIPDASSDTEREPVRDQWWPRQASSGRQNPPLPPRRSSTRSSSAQAAEPKGPRDAATEPKEPRSVNAFGDESTVSRKTWEPVQADAPEPDAFFIGESDDDDLGSLNEELPQAKSPGAEAESKTGAKSSDKEPRMETDVDKCQEPKDEKLNKEADESGEGRERRSSTAKDLLSKLRMESSEKAKAEGDKS